MAWLPTLLRKEMDISPCLVCSQGVRGFSKDLDGQKVEVMKVICHTVHVNWNALSEELDGKYPLCPTCYKEILDLAKITEELQLIENQLRSKVKNIQKIVVDYVWKPILAQKRSHCQQGRKYPHNLFQMHFIEESRNWELMRRNLEESNDEMLVVDPSMVQIHLDVGYRCSVRSKDNAPPPAPLCLSENDSPNKQPIIQRLKRRKTQLLVSKNVDTITGDVNNENEEIMEYDDEDSPRGVVKIDLSTDEKSRTLTENEAFLDFTEEVVNSGSEYHKESDSGSDTSRTNKNRNRKSMVALRAPWKMKKSGGHVFFKDVEIIKKDALPPANEKFKYILECGSCGKEIGQPITGAPSADSRYCNMKQHITAVHFSTYRCEPCQKNFSGPKALKYHLKSITHHRRHGKGSPDDNKIPLKGILTEPDGRMHYKGVEITRTDYDSGPGFDLRCSLCERVVKSEDGKRQQRCPYAILIKHISCVHKGVTYKCSICNKEYSESRNLESHFRFHHTINPPKIECDVCGKPLQSSYNLQKHIWVHKNQEERAAAIEAGEKPPITYKEFVQRRRQRLGLSEAMFQCAECGKRFELMSSLKRHEATHEEKSYECVLCGTIFRTYQERFEHTKSVHKSKKVIKKYKCRLCPKSFEHSAHLLNHEENGHTKMPYSCSACYCGFALEENLEKHLKRCLKRRGLGKGKTEVVVTPEIMSPDEGVEGEIVEEVVLVSEEQAIEMGVIEGAVVSH